MSLGESSVLSSFLGVGFCGFFLGHFPYFSGYSLVFSVSHVIVLVGIGFFGCELISLGRFAVFSKEVTWKSQAQ